MQDIESIRSKVYQLGEKIDAPKHLLSVPDRAIGNGEGYVDIKDGEFHYINEERGTVLQVRRTKDLNELLFWILRGVVAAMTSDFVKKNLNEDIDQRRLFFGKRVELLSAIDPKWGAREQADIDQILKRVPFDDLVNKRIEYTLELVTKGYSNDEADQMASERYPEPVPNK